MNIYIYTIKYLDKYLHIYNHAFYLYTGIQNVRDENMLKNASLRQKLMETKKNDRIERFRKRKSRKRRASK